MIKVKKRKILLLPGDGIGPEVIGEVKKIIKWFNEKKSRDFLSLNQLIIFLTSPITSGPIPSPGNNNIFLFLTLIIKYPRFFYFQIFFKSFYFIRFF